jgi:hypothetical protein
MRRYRVLLTAALNSCPICSLMASMIPLADCLRNLFGSEAETWLGRGLPFDPIT